MYRGTDGITTSSVPVPSAGVGANAGVSQAYPGDARQPYDATYTGSVPGSTVRSASRSSSILSGSSEIDRADLPAPTPAGAMPSAMTAGTNATPSQQVASAAPAASAFPAAPANDPAPSAGTDPVVTGTASKTTGWSADGGTQVALAPGETIYSVSRRYGVPAEEIMKANGITDATRVAAGQRLVIPTFGYGKPQSGDRPANIAAQPEPQQPEPAGVPSREVAVLPQTPGVRAGEEKKDSANATASSASGSATAKPADGVYVVKSGDTLTRIARNHDVSIDSLKQANGLSGSVLRIGQKLKIPDGTAVVPDQTVTASVKPAGEAPKAYTAPKTDAAEGKLTETAKIDTKAKAPASTGIEKLRWPARGQIITGYAETNDGKRNDGIDISVPMGSPIKAAENGVVIYSGDGLKEYGNTVLIRHDDGLVTVYAYADSLEVQRGDKVQRGQVIASSGKSGAAETPRLHFEVRKDATPVNPVTYLE